MDSAGQNLDIILVGGGLQNGLIALALSSLSPSTRVALFEADSQLGGNHTWCFHESDLSEEMTKIVAPMVAQQWPGYEVRFPRRQRQLSSKYSMITSQTFRAHLDQELPKHPNTHVHLASPVAKMSRTSVTLANGQEWHASLVIDARGPALSPKDEVFQGYQKFVGLEVELEEEHELEGPIIMDATVEQIDGYRFVYVLPISNKTLLIEDTHFSDGPEYNTALYQERIHAYVKDRGWRVAAVIREEEGVLPLPMEGGVRRPQEDAPFSAGMGANWFHPVTGYSFPVAARIAEFVANHGPIAAMGPALDEMIKEQNGQLAFAYRLNKMFFNWFTPDKRFHVLEHFYRHPEELIQRFYSFQLTKGDKARMFIGRPPKGISYKAMILGRKH